MNSIKHYYYLLAIVISLFGFIPSLATANEIQLSGIYIGGPADSLQADEGGISGLIGVRHLYLNYQRSFNYFGTLAISTDVFSSGDDFSRSIEVDELPANPNGLGESVFGGVIGSVGLTYNTNSFDNVILNFGSEIMFGNTYIEPTPGEFLKVSDGRIGFIGGVTIGFNKIFLGVDYSSNTESIRASLGYVY